MIELVLNNPYGLELDLSEALNTLELEPEELTDIKLAIKNRKRDLDSESKLIKSLLNEDIVLTDGKFYLYIDKPDYANLKAETVYHIAIGITYANLENFLELDLQGEDRVRILQDSIRA
jgi:hypothetical protein